MLIRTAATRPIGSAGGCHPSNLPLRHNKAVERLNVLLLAIEKLFEPWCTDLVEAIGDRHTLGLYRPDDPMAAQFEGVDVVIDHGGHVGTHAMMDAAAGARLWQIMSIGYEHVDVPYIRDRVRFVANVPGTTSAASLAQTALMFMLMLAHRTHECHENFHRQRWMEPCGTELEGKTLGIMGLGNSGRRLATLAHALGMHVLAATRTPPDRTVCAALGIDQAVAFDALDDMLPRCDFVSLHLALNAATHRIMDRQRLARMKPGARLINTARGGLVDEPAMIEALMDGRLGGVGLDVFDREPPDVDHPVYRLPNVIVTPHVAAYTDGSSRKRAKCIADNVDRIATGQKPLHLL